MQLLRCAVLHCPRRGRIHPRPSIPLIPGLTSDASVERTGELLASLPPVDGVNLLPFHRSARDKHRKFGMPWLIECDEEIPREQVDAWAGRMAEQGLKVGIGG